MMPCRSLISREIDDFLFTALLYKPTANYAMLAQPNKSENNVLQLHALERMTLTLRLYMYVAV